MLIVAPRVGQPRMRGGYRRTQRSLGCAQAGFGFAPRVGLLGMRRTNRCTRPSLGAAFVFTPRVGWGGDWLVNYLGAGWLVLAPGDPCRGGPGGAGYSDYAVEDSDEPVAGVQVQVVPFAEQGQVGDGGWAAVQPGDNVVRFALDGWGAADHAAFVAGVEGSAHGARDQALTGADVQWLGLRAQDDRENLGVASQPANRCGGEVVAEDEGAGRVRGRGGEILEVDGHTDVRLRPVTGYEVNIHTAVIVAAIAVVAVAVAVAVVVAAVVVAVVVAAVVAAVAVGAGVCGCLQWDQGVTVGASGQIVGLANRNA